MKIDEDRVEKLISTMRDSVRLLRELADLSETDFAEDVHKQSSAKYNFIAAIEAVIDIANHVISRKGFRAPEDYADTFRVLAESGVIEPEFSAELEKMARFRNRLVHRYWNVDEGELWNILQTRLTDFEKYISQVVRFTSDSGSGTFRMKE